jgi:hypothetical protein
VQGVYNLRQTEIHTAETLEREPSVFDFQTTIQKLNRYKSPGIHQIPTELLKAGSRRARSQIHKLINSIWNKEKLPEERKESIIVPVYKNGDKT